MYLFISCVSELAGLIKFTRPFLTSVSKAKAAKLVRTLVDEFLDMEASTGKEVRKGIEHNFLNDTMRFTPLHK